MAYLKINFKEYDTVNTICEKINSLQPKNERAYEIKGDLFKEIGNYNMAFFFYTKAIEINPESSTCMTSIA
jgi:tetratricopeptide (TPR) repeat protein